MDVQNTFAVSPQNALISCSSFPYKKTFSFISISVLYFDAALDCVPKSQCKPTQNYNTTKLEPGFKAIIDTTGCCPVSKLICDKSLCPPRPIQCTEAFYVVEKTKSADDKICCDIYECRKFSTYFFLFCFCACI